jgi:hypothetical protein
MYPFIQDLKLDPSIQVKKENLFWNSQQVLTQKTSYCVTLLAQILYDFIEEKNLLGVFNISSNKFTPQFINLTYRRGK